MTVDVSNWVSFPYDVDAFDYSGTKLEKAWPRLHRGDCEPFPDLPAIAVLADRYPDLAPSTSAAVAQRQLQDAWRAYHCGAFGRAVELGRRIGRLGYGVANKATNIYATYLEKDRGRRRAMLRESAARSEEIQACAPDAINAWYFHAQALGRYSQYVSVAKALGEGLGAKIKASLDRVLKLEPKHADAHIALGVYNAVIVNKLGATIASLTYAASRDSALEHFETALKLNPESAIARIEYGNALAMLFGKAKLAKAIALYEQAAVVEPADAMERLDVELARAELRD